MEFDFFFSPDLREEGASNTTEDASVTQGSDGGVERLGLPSAWTGPIVRYSIQQ